MFQRITDWVDRNIEVGARLIAMAGLLPLGVIAFVTARGSPRSPLEAHPIVSIIALSIGGGWAAFVLWRLARFEIQRWRQDIVDKDR